MNLIEQTRIRMSEHSYPTPTRNHLSMHNREAGKRKDAQPTQATEVRFGIRKDGVDTMETELTSERHARRAEERANEILERRQRTEDLMRNLNETMAAIDTWATKS